MKKHIFLLFLSLGFLVTSCEEELLVYDSENGASLASFQNQTPATLVFNPASDTENIYTVSVSTVSDTDRNVSLMINESSTIDESFYSISTLNPVIPAGSFSVDVIVTTFASNEFPSQGATLNLDIVSVDGAEVLSDSVTSYSIPFTVECPSTDIGQVVGTAMSTDNSLLVAFGLTADAADPRTVVAGPGENQVTIIGGFGASTSDDIILNIDPNSGNITDGSPDGTLIFVNGGTTPVPISGLSGRALTCINQISIVVQNQVFAPPFDSFSLQLIITP